MNSLINIGIILTYVFVFAALGLILYFSVRTLLSDLKEAKSTFIGVGAILLIFILSYVISSSNDVSNQIFEKTQTNPALSKLIGSGPIMLYFLVAIVFVTIIYSQVVKFLKK